MKTLHMHPGLEDDLYKLKNNPYLTLRYIGDKYNLSRERIRQIYNQFFNTSYGQHKNKRNDDLSCAFDPRNKKYLIDKDSKIVSRKYNAILKFIEMCKNRNLKIESPKNKSVTIIINGFNIKVKSTLRSNYKFSPGQKCTYNTWQLHRNEIINNHFFALYIDNTDKFVILKNKFKNKYKFKAIYMRDNKSNYRTVKNRYWDLINRFDLIEIKN